MTAAAIDIRSATKTYASGPEAIHAFGPSSLRIAPGEFISLVGPSGCGKSTLMLMIAGLLDCTSGEIEVAGEVVRAPQTSIGIMFQDNTLVPWRTVRGNVELQIELRGLPVADYRATVDRLISSVKLDGFAERYPYELSGGMQQRAAFCQTLVHRPGVLLLDEPLGKLDAMTREAIRRDLQTLWLQDRPTVVFVTHSIEEAIQLSTRVCVISPRPGRIEKVIDIDLPWPRDLAVKRSEKFSAYASEIEEIFHGYGVL
ncbi:ABC transporter ATP-binding protein [Taklimakanibacter deserti]|uniref:ABC transporter ATP-binding protein n=1 Tax=Taklimakanibacter deserti TaxID=2267839 RepID=UPI000E650B95